MELSLVRSQVTSRDHYELEEALLAAEEIGLDRSLVEKAINDYYSGSITEQEKFSLMTKPERRAYGTRRTLRKIIDTVTSASKRVSEFNKDYQGLIPGIAAAVIAFGAMGAAILSMNSSLQSKNFEQKVAEVYQMQLADEKRDSILKEVVGEAIDYYDSYRTRSSSDRDVMRSVGNGYFSVLRENGFDEVEGIKLLRYLYNNTSNRKHPIDFSENASRYIRFLSEKKFTMETGIVELERACQKLRRAKGYNFGDRDLINSAIESATNNN